MKKQTKDALIDMMDPNLYVHTGLLFVAPLKYFELTNNR